MKKGFLTVAIFLFVALSLSAINFSKAFPQTVYGFLNTKNDLVVMVDETVLPFNLLADVVSKNASLNAVRGLCIGSYTMSSNDDSFKLKVRHDKLKSDLPSKEGTYTYLDYRLDLFYGTSNSTFVTCFADAPIEITKHTNPNVFPKSPYVITEQSIYVSMNEERSVLEAANGGTYSSTIYFEMTIEQ